MVSSEPSRTSSEHIRGFIRSVQDLPRNGHVASSWPFRISSEALARLLQKRPRGFFVTIHELPRGPHVALSEPFRTSLEALTWCYQSYPGLPQGC